MLFRSIRQDPADWDGHGYQAVCGLPSFTKKSSMRPVFEGTANFIANAPDDVRYLLAALTAKDEEIARLKAGMKETGEALRLLGVRLSNRTVTADDLAAMLRSEDSQAVER